MPGDCPAALAPTDLCLWKTFRSKPNTIPVAHTKVFAIPPERCSPSDRNAARNHNGMVFGFTPESRSPSTGFRTINREVKKLILPRLETKASNQRPNQQVRVVIENLDQEA